MNDILNELMIEERYGATVLPSQVLRNHGTAHEGGCSALSWDPKSDLFVSGGMDRIIRVWANGANSTINESVKLVGAIGSILDLSISFDSQFIISGSSDKCARVWSRKTERVVHMLQGHSDQVLTVNFLPFEPLRAVTAGKDRVLKVWEASRGICSRSMPCHSIINASEVGSDGTLYTGHFDGKLRQWDFRTGKQTLEMADLHGGSGGITSLCLAKNGYTMLTYV